jgi:hypothetical protein
MPGCARLPLGVELSKLALWAKVTLRVGTVEEILSNRAVRASSV